MKRRIIAGIMILAMFASLGFMPTGEVSAATPLASAKNPARYQKGYKIYRAIDISAHQDYISVNQFKQMKARGITHVIMRSSYTRLASFTLKTDKRFKSNINNAYKAGMKIGIYHYSQALTPTEAKKEAAYTLKQIRPYRSKITLPVAFDFEFGKRFNSNYARKKGRTYMTGVVTTYCEAIRKAGFKPMVYASASVLNRYVDRGKLQAKYPIWVAHYTRNGKATDYSGSIYMWQYTSSGRLKTTSGKNIISGRVDMNYIFVKSSGKAAAKKTTAKTTGYKVRTTGNVNKRSGPAKTYKKVGVLKKGTTVTVLQTKNGWGRIGKGVWFSLKYAKRI